MGLRRDPLFLRCCSCLACRSGQQAGHCQIALGDRGKAAEAGERMQPDAFRDTLDQRGRVQSSGGYPVGIPAPHDVVEDKPPPEGQAPKENPVKDLFEPAVSRHGGAARADLEVPGWCLDHRRDLGPEGQPDAEPGRNN